MISIRFLDKEQREQIGFSFILDNLNLNTVYGLDEKKLLKPFKKSERSRLAAELDNLETVIESIEKDKSVYREIITRLRKLKDIRNSLRRCKNLNILDDVELYELKFFAIIMNEVIQCYEKLNISIIGIKFCKLEEVITLLDPEGMGIPTFYIYDKYSKNLRSLRERKREIENKIFEDINEETKAKLKQQRLEIVIQEEQEEMRIRKELTEQLFEYISIINENIYSIGKLDLLIAKAELTIKYKGVRPEIQENMEILMEDAFNPEVVEILFEKGKEFTPISIAVKSGTTVITGANMGGKSVTLKTIVLNMLLGQMGFFVFCKKAKIPILDFIQFISDDMQNISKGLSTFGAEIIKLKEVLSYVKNYDGFVALDEFARGTNPKEGMNLVKSLCDYLNKFSTITVISTHYDGVVNKNMTHYQVIGLKNVDFGALKQKIDLNRKQSIEIIQKHMEYKLEKVSKESKVPKDALNISMLLGLEPELISIAKQYYEANQFTK